MSDPTPIKTAVITGGHPYDVMNFHRLFRSIPHVELFIQHLDDFATSPAEVRAAYDVVLFYIMMMEGPADEGVPWYAGQPRTALEELGRPGQGVFVLHHALLAYPQWPVWNQVVGIEDRSFDFHIGQQVPIQIAASGHPITAGLDDWTMTDETYTMAGPGDDSEVLLTTNHPKSMTGLAWTRQFRDSRVFCFQSGHDNDTWSDAGFQHVLARGIQWCAGRI